MRHFIFLLFIFFSALRSPMHAYAQAIPSRSTIVPLALLAVADVDIVATVALTKKKFQRCDQVYVGVPEATTTTTKAETEDWNNKSEIIIKNNEFVVGRGLVHYFFIFQKDLMHSLQNLKSGDHILDAGAGEADAIRQILQSDEFPHRPKATVISYTISPKRLEKLREIPGVNIFTGKYFEEIPPSHLVSEFGKVKILLDLFGVLSYTSHPSEVLNTYLDILDDSGQIYVHLGVAGLNQVYERKGQKPVDFFHWIKKNRDIEIKIIRSPESEEFTFIITKKISRPAVFPPLRLLFIDETSEPPYHRSFQELDH